MRAKEQLGFAIGFGNYSFDKIQAEDDRGVGVHQTYEGARVVLEAIGPDEQEALNQLEALLLRFRDEEGGAQGN
jgi:hypothetical protein